jgi:hypothetical protein
MAGVSIDPSRLLVVGSSYNRAGGCAPRPRFDARKRHECRFDS